MKRTEVWKNFALGTELDIAGTFIFNGLRRLHEIESLHYDAEVFEVLYNLAVGIERLLKVVIILLEHQDTVNQADFEESLITHNHQELVRRIRAQHNLKLSGLDNELLDLLSTFYNKLRYGRYTLASVGVVHSEKKLFHRYIEKHLKIKIDDTFPFQITPIDRQIRKFIGKRVGKIVTELYNVIDAEAHRLNIYTYEVRIDSKADKIFIRQQFEFIDEDVLWKELLLFILASEGRGIGIIDFMKRLEPLEFDPGLINDYLQCFTSEEKKLHVLGELETLYEDIDDVKERLASLAVIGDPSVYFDADDSNGNEGEGGDVAE